MTVPIRFPTERRRDVTVPGAAVVPASPAGALAVRRRNRRGPIIAGCVIIGVFVVGMLGWAALASITGAVDAPGVMRVESNLKTIKHLEGGTVRAISVRDGDRVKRGQLLMTFDRLQPQASSEVLRNQYDTALAERARYEAELRRAPAISFPAELTARAADPAVASLIADQESLFQSRRSVADSQLEVLQQRQSQLETRIEGLQAQVEATRLQASLITEELAGVRTLHERGYAPKTRLLALERTAAGLGGRRGELVSEISQAREGIGEARIQMIELTQRRQSEAAEGRSRAQERISDLLPKLRIAENTLTNTEVRSPVDGFVLNLTQFTEGGVAGAGETLMDIVPSGAPLIVDVKVRPADVDEVQVGQRAKVRLSAYSSQRVPSVDAEVVTVSADRLTDAQTGEPFFRTTLRIDSDDLRRVSGQVKLAPGMPADAMISTRPRTILDYLVGPVKDTLSGSLREQ